MPVIAMKATSVVKHPNAQRLLVCTFSAPDSTDITVVVNSERSYKVGDVVAIATVGTLLLDGTRVRRAKLRGVASQGLALGTSLAEVGEDVGEGLVGEEEVLGEGALLKWTSIELLHNIRSLVLDNAANRGGPSVVEYRGKVKLHGTNAGVQILKDGSVVAQGRNRVLSLSADNSGFAAWVLKNRAYFESLASADRHLTLYGEWCGPGIQRGVAINDIDRKVFAIFAAQIGDHLKERSTLLIEPEQIQALLPEHADVFVLPWFSEPVRVDFQEPNEAVQQLNALVEEVENSDPWVLKTFGVRGVGEGLVFYPVSIASQDREDLTSLLFKAKGQKHRVRKAKEAVVVDPVVAKSIEDFVETFATEARFEQAISVVCSGPRDMRQVGVFLRWVNEDILKESVADLQKSRLVWKQVSRAVATKATAWFRSQL